MNVQTYLTTALILSLGMCGHTAHALTAADLKCEYQVQPLAIDTLHPRLSWVLHSSTRGDEATSIHILVASSLTKLGRGEGDLWNASFKSPRPQIVYEGKLPQSGQACFWKVCVADKRGVVGPWSHPTRWEMGLLSPSDWNAEWINDGKRNPTGDADFYKNDPAPLFRKQFLIRKHVRRARLAITGLGYYEASLNGARIGDQHLGPAWTRYTEKVFYTVYDVTRQLHSGANCLGVTLGNGWYNPLPLRMWGTYNLRLQLPVGRPRFIAHLELEFDDGGHQTVVSDTSWKVTDGPLQFNSIYLGEVYDARRELTGWDRPNYDDAGWRRPARATEPIGTLQCQFQPPIRITHVLQTRAIIEPRPGTYVFDMGRNFAGWVRLKLSVPASTKIVLRYGELLNKDGTLNPMTSVAGQIKGAHKLPDGRMESVGGPGAPNIAWQSDTYIASGKGSETYTPRFTFHGFRYVEVTGYPGHPTSEMLTGLQLNSDVERVGSFTCSNPLLNRIQEMCDNTFLSNIFSVQSDCPHRERFGYGGDVAATSEAFMMNYDMEGFYAKAVEDWKENALPDGMFTDTAPFVGIQYCGVAWAMAHPLLQRQLYQYYGDRRLIEEQYTAASRWLDLVSAQYPSHLIQDGLSDHESLAPTSAPILVTPLYAECADILAQLAHICAIDSQDDPGSRSRFASESVQYDALATHIRDVYRTTYGDPVTGKVGDGTQASQSFALALKMVPEQARPLVLARLIEQIHGPDKDHLSTGIFGTKFLLDSLSRAGRGDLAYTIVTQKSYPGWGNMIENGATTLWEHWQGSDNTYSQNHPMFGSVSQWLYQWVGGIRPAADAVGFDKIEIDPLIMPQLSAANCRYRSVLGEVSCSWRRIGRRLLVDVEIPIGATARLRLPASLNTPILESGATVVERNGVEHVRRQGEFAEIQIESGKYRFEFPGTDPDTSRNVRIPH